MNNEMNPWIQNHKVCFESSPFYCQRNSTKHQIGYELHLFAQSNGSGKTDPGSRKSYELYKELQRIAREVIPEDANGYRCQIESFDFSIRLRTETGMKEEVQLALLVVHRENYFAPADRSQAECIEKMQRRLSEMGARSRAWR